LIFSLEKSMALDEYLAIIPARGGSKGIPLKNITPLLGRPLIEYTFDAALNTPGLNRVVVSTDHPAITSVCEKRGVLAIQRPPEIAADTSRTEDALIHVLDVLQERDGWTPRWVLTLEPTAPLRTSKTIRGVMELACTQGTDSVVSVAPTTQSFGRIVDGRFALLFPNQARRRQDREPLYYESGTAWCTREDVLRSKRCVIGDEPRSYVVSAEEAVDINGPADLLIAEALLRTKLNRDA
jgi:CMP-N,N'-diacetyllegionaminic acid synthase